MTQNSQETVIGRITSVFGVKGWLKVFSYTDPKEGILNYPDWTLDLDGKRIPAKLEEGRRQGDEHPFIDLGTRVQLRVEARVTLRIKLRS